MWPFKKKKVWLGAIIRKPYDHNIKTLGPKPTEESEVNGLVNRILTQFPIDEQIVLIVFGRDKKEAEEQMRSLIKEELSEYIRESESL